MGETGGSSGAEAATLAENFPTHCRQILLLEIDLLARVSPFDPGQRSLQPLSEGSPGVPVQFSFLTSSSR